MSSELFNSITGYSVGIPPTLVVNSSGTILTNVDNDYGDECVNVKITNDDKP